MTFSELYIIIICRYPKFLHHRHRSRVKCQIYTTRVTTPRISSNFVEKEKNMYVRDKNLGNVTWKLKSSEKYILKNNFNTIAMNPKKMMTYHKTYIENVGEQRRLHKRYSMRLHRWKSSPILREKVGSSHFFIRKASYMKGIHYSMRFHRWKSSRYSSPILRAKGKLTFFYIKCIK